MSPLPYARGVNPRLAAVLQAKAARDWQASAGLLPANDRETSLPVDMAFAGDDAAVVPLMWRLRYDGFLDETP